MSDDAGTTTAPDAPAATGTDGQPPAGTAPSAQAGAGDDAPSLSPEDARKLRSEAKNLRDRLKSAEEDLKRREDAELNERQRLDRDKTALEARVSQLESDLREKSVQIVAAKIGVRSDLVDAVSALVDWTDVDSSDPKDVERAVKALLKERPSLSGKGEGLDGGAGRGNGGRGSGEDASLTELLLQRTGRA